MDWTPQPEEPRDDPRARRKEAIRALAAERAQQLSDEMPSGLKARGAGQAEKRKAWLRQRAAAVFADLPVAEQEARMRQLAASPTHAREEAETAARLAISVAQESAPLAAPSGAAPRAKPRPAPLSEVQTRQRYRRKVALRAALDQAGCEGDPVGPAALLAEILQPEERTALRELLRPEQAPASWPSRVGAHMVQTLAASPGGASTLMGAFAQGCRSAGLRNRRVIKRHLKVTIPWRAWWGQTTLGARGAAGGRPTTIHRPSLIKRARSLLVANSRETCSTRRPWTQGQGEARIPVRALTCSKSRLRSRTRWLRGLLSRSSFFTHLKHHHRQFVKARKRVDVCDYCLAYDRSYKPYVLRAIPRIRARVERVDPSYFKAFDANPAIRSLLEQPRKEEALASLPYARGLLRFMEKQQAERSKTPVDAPGISDQMRSVRWRLDLRDAEIKSMEALTPIERALAGFEHHWHSLRRQHDASEKLIADPPPGMLYVCFDFKENDTIPKGPAEGGDWYWANAREQIATLGFFVCCRADSGALRRSYFHYVSGVMDHTCLFTVAALKDLLSRVHGGTYSHLHFWRDCGPHFRCYETLAFALADVPKITGAESVVVNYFAEKHGKGRVDGCFGLQARWVADYAMRREILTRSDYIAACRAGAAETTASDPGGPSYTIVDFTPPAKPESITKLANHGLSVQATYCVQAVQKDGLLRLRNVVYSDRLDMPSQPAYVLGSPVLARSSVSQSDWRIAYRTNFPESAPIKHQALAGRLADQACFKTGPLACRREREVDNIVKAERARAKKQAKAARIRRAMSPSSSSSSSDSSSDSAEGAASGQ